MSDKNRKSKSDTTEKTEKEEDKTMTDETIDLSNLDLDAYDDDN